MNHTVPDISQYSLTQALACEYLESWRGIRSVAAEKAGTTATTLKKACDGYQVSRHIEEKILGAAYIRLGGETFAKLAQERKYEIEELVEQKAPVQEEVRSDSRLRNRLVELSNIMLEVSAQLETVLASRIEDLLDENTKLRDENARLKSENNRLNQLLGSVVRVAKSLES